MSVQWTPIRLAMEAAEERKSSDTSSVKGGYRNGGRGSLTEGLGDSVEVGWTRAARSGSSDLFWSERGTPDDSWMNRMSRHMRPTGAERCELCWGGNGGSPRSERRWSPTLGSSTPAIIQNNRNGHKLKTTFTTVAVLENARHFREVQSEKGLKLRCCDETPRDTIWKRSVGLQVEMEPSRISLGRTSESAVLHNQPSHVALPPEKETDHLAIEDSTDAAVKFVDSEQNRKDVKQNHLSEHQKEDHECCVNCLYYTMQCCDCTII